jgi:hypothetical protein
LLEDSEKVDVERYREREKQKERKVEGIAEE